MVTFLAMKHAGSALVRKSAVSVVGIFVVDWLGSSASSVNQGVLSKILCVQYATAR